MTTAQIEDQRRILVIDDNPSIHSDFRKILVDRSRDTFDLGRMGSELFGRSTSGCKRPSFQLEMASQGEAGLALVRQAVEAGRPFAMAFVDVRMPPGWDGVETTARLWEVDPDLHVVICTAHSDYSWEEMISRLGHSDRLVILKKPFEVPEVLQLANALTEKRRLLEQVRRHVSGLEETICRRTEELRKSEELFRLITQNAVDLIAIIDGQGQQVYTSPSYQKELGLSPEELVAPLWRRVHPDDVPRFRAAIQATIESGDGRILEYRFQHQDGSWRHLEAHSDPFRNSQGTTEGALVVARDVTVRRLLEEQLRQAQKMEAIGQLAGGVAHDFNNILAATLMRVEFLSASPDLPPEIRESLADLRDDTKRASNLTRQLLMFSRRHALQIKPVDLNEVIDNLLKMLRRVLGENVDLEFQSEPGTPWIEADAGMMEQVIMNLAVNARDAMARGGRLTISTRLAQLDQIAAGAHPGARPGRFACLSVRDSGCGMDASTLKHLFEPFFTTKEVGKGTGLGLATVYGIVKQHRGWVEVASAVGQGSTFCVYFPASSRSVGTAGAPAETPPAGGHETILLVEDDQPVRVTTAAVLQRAGYQLVLAGNAEEVLAFSPSERERIMLLITDMILPGGMTGLELGKRLQDERKDLRVLVMSGYSLDSDTSRMLRHQKLDFLAKPCEPKTFLRVVRECLDRR